MMIVSLIKNIIIGVIIVVIIALVIVIITSQLECYQLHAIILL